MGYRRQQKVTAGSRDCEHQRVRLAAWVELLTHQRRLLPWLNPSRSDLRVWQPEPVEMSRDSNRVWSAQFETSNSSALEYFGVLF